MSDECKKGKTMLKKKFLVLSLIIFMTLFLVLNLLSKKLLIDEIQEDAYYSNEKGRYELLKFLREYFFVQDVPLIRTSFIEENLMATGEEILSESLALYLEYALINDEAQEYKSAVTILKEFFIDEDYLIRWKIKYNDQPPLSPTINAPVDDLRIIRTLFLAGERFENDEYIELAVKLSDALYEHTVQNNHLLAFNHPSAKKAPLVYNDFFAFYLIQNHDSRWRPVLNKSIKFTLKKQVCGFPFYEDDYWLKEGLTVENQFMVLENFWVFYNLSRIGYKDEDALLWIIESIEKGPILGRYNRIENSFWGYESPSIYALVAKIALVYHEPELYNMAITKLDQMVIKSGDYKGGFVDLISGQAYSYDQLLPLIAY